MLLAHFIPTKVAYSRTSFSSLANHIRRLYVPNAIARSRYKTKTYRDI